MPLQKLKCAAGLLALTCAITPLAQATPELLASKPVTLSNPGFDADNAAVPAPLDWTSSGASDTDFTEWGSRLGDEGYRLSHWSATDYQVTTSQTVTGLKRGWYTLRTWVRKSTGTNNAYVELDCGSTPNRVAVPAAWPGQWLQVAVSAEVKRNQCTINLNTTASANEWTNFDDVTLETGKVKVPVRGADVSSLAKSEDFGGLYYPATKNGKKTRPESALSILKDQGTTHVRLRVWVDPADGYHDLRELRQMAKRAKKEGLKVLVDLHYSDIWADPGHQDIPSQWRNLSVPQLEAAIFMHTLAACAAVRDSGTYPDMVQIGNELNSGMLWPYGHTWNPAEWENLGRFLKAGYMAVKLCSPKTKVVLHLAEGGKNDTFKWWFDNIIAQGVKFDVIAASYYGYWHGSMGDLQYNLNDLAVRYGKEILVAETAYPFTLDAGDNFFNNIGLPEQLVPGYPATPEGQAANLRDVLSVVRAIPNGLGLGVFYWDATWTAVPGNGWDPLDPTSGNNWENQALFDYKGVATPAMSEFSVDK